MRTVWEANSPDSKAVVTLPGGEEVTLKRVLDELRRVTPSFENLAPNSNEGSAGNPTAPSLQITDTGEKAYQRAFLRQKSTEISGSVEGRIHVEWLDIEAPVVAGTSPRRSCLDMIGAVKGVPSVIAELKEAGGTSPFHAIQEVLSYGCRAQENHEWLTSHTHLKDPAGNVPLRPYWREYVGKYLVIAGPDDYWKKWEFHWDLILAIGTKWLLNSGLQGHRLIFASFPSVDFKEQMGGSESYIPQVNDSGWSVTYEAHYPATPQPRHAEPGVGADSR